MFTEAERDQIRARLLDRAHADWRVTGAAVTGSASRGAEDRWSDVDLFFGVAAEIAPEEVLADWSEYMYRELGALHHFDLRSGPAIYRAFLLPECLEVDVAFTPATEFGALGPHFQLVFGEAIERPAVAGPDRNHIIGLAWHHVLHGRICIERNKLWQAEYWISGIRDHALALACLRFGQPARYAKGVDSLPTEVAMRFEDALVRALTPSELRRALGAAATQLLREVREADSDLARRLEGPLLELAPAARGPHQAPWFSREKANDNTRVQAATPEPIPNNLDLSFEARPKPFERIESPRPLLRFRVPPGEGVQKLEVLG